MGAAAQRAGYPSSVPTLELTRRAFLGRSLQAAGVLAAMPALACSISGKDAAAPALAALHPTELPILDAVADTFVPSGGAFAAGARDVGLPLRIDAFAAAQGPDVVRGVRGALWFVELASPALAGRAGRFSRLSPADRAAALQALVDSRLSLSRDVFAGLKQLCLFTFYSLDASWPATGYDGPWVQRARGVA